MPIPAIAQRSGAASLPLPLETVLHHHAHAAACGPEHRWPLDGGDVIALTLDEVLGTGGERRAVGRGVPAGQLYRECEHLGGLPASRATGGTGGTPAVAKLLAHCRSFCPLGWRDYPQAATLRQRDWPLALRQAIERAIDAPRASSCGRLFDAVARALDCAPE